jgi:E3 ubiquitin-protein ligase DOA10
MEQEQQPDQCRICYENNNLLLLKCNCNTVIQYIHYKCANKWFADKIHINLSGMIKSKLWEVNYSCKCEVCNSPINPDILNDIVKDNDILEKIHSFTKKNKK